MPTENFDKLLKTIVWYDNMPSFLEVGDRFHENMSEEIDNMLPAILELDSQDYYNGGVEEEDGKLFMTLINESDEEDEFFIELIPV